MIQKSHKLFNFIAAAVLGTMLVTAVPLSMVASNRVTNEVQAAVGNYTTNPATYYNSVSGLSGNPLLFGLHDLMISTHSTYPSYDDSGSRGHQAYTDKDPNTPGNIITFYAHASISSNWSLGVYDREHVWPQSLSNGLYGTSNAGADMHHIRPTIKAINNARSNKEFGYVGTTYSTISYGSGNLVSKHTSDIFEPHDEVKGDAARIIMYMYVHYNSSQALGNGSLVEPKTTTLPITNVVDGANSQEAFNLLLEWNSLDPVDILETNRNNQVATYQGNRNPFIDHPEYADLIWGTTTAPTSLSISPSSANVGVGNTETLTVTASPSGSSNAVTWSSSNESVATVANGIVTGVSSGNATITATSNLNASVTATSSITVSNIAVSSVSLDETASLSVGSTTTLTPVFSPANASNKSVTWASSNPSVASINSSTGLITGLSAGTTTITVTTVDGGKTDTCLLTVSVPSSYNATYAITAKNTVTLSGNAPSGSTASLVETYSTSKQMTGGNSQTLTLSGWNNHRIIGITLSMKSNTSSGAGNFTYSVDGGSTYSTLIATANFNASSWNGTWSTSYVPINITGLNITALESDLVFKIAATANSLYCESYSFQYEPVVSQKTLSSIAVTAQPTNTSYYDGDSFNPAGLVVTATYSDSSTAVVTESCTFTPNPLTQGTTAITVSYTESAVTKTTTITGITVSANNVASIAITTPATNSTFTLGSSFSSAGLAITVTYENESTQQLSSGFDVSGFDTGKLGQQTVTITYAGKTTSYSIIVTNNGASVSSGSGGSASDLFISEIIEGSSNNKAVEIYNGTGSSINLSNYRIAIYANGSSSPGNIVTLSGTLQNNATYVVVYSSATTALKELANLTSGSLSHSGDDAVALQKNQINIDLIGIIGTRTNYNTDVTLVRKSSVSSPTTTYSASEWDSYSTDTFSYLGSHAFAGGGSSGDVTANQQAVAWASYFLEMTEETCLAMTGAFGSYWNDLALEYGYMVSEAKDAFVDNSESNATITDATERYLFIVQKYSLDDFVEDGDGNAINSPALMNVKTERNALVTIAIIVGVSVTAIVFLTIASRKKETTV